MPNDNNDLTNKTKNCSQYNCSCNTPSLTRRQFFAASGAAGAAGAMALTSALPLWAQASPPSDYTSLIPTQKNLPTEWVHSLFTRNQPAVYKKSELDYIGMPVGGICSGQVYLGGDGKLWLWDIFNQLREGVVSGQKIFQGKPVRARDGMNYVFPPQQHSPFDQGFAIQVTSNSHTVTKSLDRNSFKNVTFLGQYPIGNVNYHDPDLPVSVSLKAYSPFIPLNTDDSSLPAVAMQYTVKNTSSARANVELLGWLENAICLYSESKIPGSCRNRVNSNSQFTALSCTAQEPSKGQTQERPDIVFENFEKDSYKNRTATGTAFGNEPIITKEMPGYQGQVGAQGKRLVNTHNTRQDEDIPTADAHTGTMTSNPFTIDRKFITFLVGGGSHQGKTCINLLLDGKAVRTATGRNNNQMGPHSFNVEQFAGQTAKLQIVDDHSGGWGNISIDDIVFSDQPRGATENLTEQYDFGSMSLAVLGDPDQIKAATSVSSPVNFDNLSSVTDAANNPATQPFDNRPKGALTRSFSLVPGAEETVTFAIAWNFPNLKINGVKTPTTRHYATRFNSALDTVGYLSKNFKSLSSQTELWKNTWYDSTLPHWLLDRTFANTSTLATSTVYRFSDGRFWAWEGVGCCQGTCTHVWHYAQSVARIFPELERAAREINDFGLGFNQDSGAIRFRAEFNQQAADDGQAGTILRAYREHQMAPDSSFLKANWPQIKKATLFLINKDANHDGIIEGAQHNTLDAAWYGKIAFLASLYIATLHAARAMALEMNDADFANRCQKIADQGRQNILKLFNGEYFIQLEDPNHLDAIGTGAGCYIDQVFGQSWAFQLGLGRILSEKHTKSALQSLWKYNFAPDIGPFKKTYKKGRPYALPGEGGLIMCSWPKGEKRDDWEKHWQFGYFNECMSGFEYQVAAHMIAEGMVEQGLAITRAIHDRYHPAKRNPYNEVECSDHYARAMASYGVFIAISGYQHHGPKGFIAFDPKITPENFRSAFTANQAWGTFQQKRSKSVQTESITVKFGSLKLKTLQFQLPPKTTVSSVHAAIDNLPINLIHSCRDQTINLQSPNFFQIPTDSTLEIKVNLH